MNKKLIAAAVSAVVVVPVAAQAEMSVYARVNNAIDINGLGDGSTDVSTVGSRFGFRGSADIGGGLTAHGRYEFATTTDKEQPNVADLRLGTVGVSGGFGRVDIGNQWSSYFQTFGTLVSPTYSLGAHIYNSVGGGPYRSSNTIKYSNSFGPVHAVLDVRLNESGEDAAVAEGLRGDGIGLGVSVAIADNFTIAAAYDSEDVTQPAVGPGTDRIGIGGKGSFGDYWASLGWQNLESGPADTSSLFLYGSGSISEKTNWLTGYSTGEDGANDDATQLTWGVYHNMGGGLRLYYEGTAVEIVSKAIDGTRHLLGMRVDF